MNRSRYALYFVPEEGTRLDLFGSSWVGRSSYSGRHLTPAPLPPEIETLRLKYMGDPHRYGFHATLKPPFALASGLGRKQLTDALSVFAQQQLSFQLPPLTVRSLDRFIALVPTAGTQPIYRLADDCVRHFDDFRAPLSQEELTRRRAAHLTPRQDQLLCEWGYPYVFDEFRFHMTLTGHIDSDEERGILQAALQDLWQDCLPQPILVDAVTLLVEETKGQAFYVLDRFPFARR